jgi:hypothetical protein
VRRYVDRGDHVCSQDTSERAAQRKRFAVAERPDLEKYALKGRGYGKPLGVGVATTLIPLVRRHHDGVCRTATETVRVSFSNAMTILPKI